MVSAQTDEVDGDNGVLDCWTVGCKWLVSSFELKFIFVLFVALVV